MNNVIKVTKAVCWIFFLLFAKGIFFLPLGSRHLLNHVKICQDLNFSDATCKLLVTRFYMRPP